MKAERLIEHSKFEETEEWTKVLSKIVSYDTEKKVAGSVFDAKCLNYCSAVIFKYPVMLQDLSVDYCHKLIS